MTAEGNVIIVGGGLSGLCCARRLHQAGITCTVLEASDAVGGRVRSDFVDGFILDRGFQIFLSAYPEARAVLNYDALDFKPFFPGASVFLKGKFHKLADPWRNPGDAVSTLFSPVGTMADKLKLAIVRQRALESSSRNSAPGSATTLQALERVGFSKGMIASFFRPFFSGIFLEGELATDASLFNFVFKMLAVGDNVLPAGGMQAIPNQIADSLPKNSIKLNSKVDSLDGKSVLLASGEKLTAKAVVVAVDEPHASNLLGAIVPKHFRSQTCVYMTADKAPIETPLLLLDGEGKGPVNNFCVPSNVSKTYAPAGKALLCHSVVGDSHMSDAALQSAIIEQMTEWFGNQVSGWKHLKTYRIKYALPDQTPPVVAAKDRRYKAESGVYACGDYKETGSINGAMLSGRKAAEAVMQDLSS